MAMLLLSVPFQKPVTAVVAVSDVLAAPAEPVATGELAVIATPSPAQAIAARPASGQCQCCPRKILAIAICRPLSRLQPLSTTTCPTYADCRPVGSGRRGVSRAAAGPR